ncbi:3-deoxy-manno-octulosonate cytidylyltransferase [Fluviispira sanaruensis]|uniref:3-deoxy-manno-octulosonate cytidylyltransferase n=1 Tax=Fluviispira sanaruensis TaxID=2493639 RepID=A0A4P2VPG3_FLUSA|nr:3-deoxy-manno-octulosonate cytidylyltransferase [Fluviispira sanaruensis]BBH54070.1 3-deoxy-manno-octulosonate cytidylyltransferase [Fluviispira sanaruensis]
MKNKKHLCIIPARMGSSRFPNKPLAKICGIPMIGHVALRATSEPIFDNVVVATCDNEIVDYCNTIHIKTIMTSNKHERATDRTQEATEKIENELKFKYDFVTMLQGDEPMITPDILRKIVQKLNAHHEIDVLNLISSIKESKEFYSNNCVKIVQNFKKEILYFSRSPIPFNNPCSMHHTFKQLGIIAFRRNFLDVYSKLSPTYLEELESVDMLRCLEHGYKINTLEIKEELYPVDVLEDIIRVEKYLTTSSISI